MTDVLIVDDDASLRTLLGEFLSGLGYGVTTASNGADGLTRLRRHRPDVLVLDLEMPIVDGWSVLRTCRQTSELADLPVVVISGMPSADAALGELSVSCRLVKPFDLRALTHALENIETATPQLCAYCHADSSPHRVRVFTPDNPGGVWPLCDSCWTFLEVGFRAHRPGESLHKRLTHSIPVNAVEIRGWLGTGVQQVRRRSSFG